jgi:hypothetical protein
MAAGTMKTSYYLVTAAGLAAAAAIVYTQWPGSSKAREVPPPTVPLAADAKPLAPGDMTLPPIVTPPDGHLVIPVAAPAAEPQVPPPAAAPQLPAPPSTPPAPLPVPPAEPMVPPVPVGTPPLPTPPAIPPMPAPPAAQPTPTSAPPLLPAPTTPVAPPAAQPTPPPAVPAVPPVTPSPAPMAPPAVVIPPAAPTNPEPPIAPSAPPAAPTLRRVPPADPAAPQEPPAIPAAPPAIPAAPAAPTVPPPAPDLSIPASPAAPVVPMTPPPAPLITPAPPAAQPVLPKPAPLPEPVPAKPSAGAQLPQLPPPGTDERPTSGKYIVLKGDRLGDKLIEGSVAVAGDKAVIRQGSFDRTVAKSDVLFVGESKDEVYRFMLAKVPANDAAARLGVAKWCMFSGLREQALAEAKEILKLQPRNNDAAGMVRSLDESLKNFPGDGTVQVVAKPAGVLEAVEPEPDVTPEGATNFSTRAQPVLANQCMDCHARADYPGAFKLIRVTGFELGPQSTKSNLRAAAAQLKKDDPLNSPAAGEGPGGPRRDEATGVREPQRGRVPHPGGVGAAGRRAGRSADGPAHPARAGDGTDPAARGPDPDHPAGRHSTGRAGGPARDAARDPGDPAGGPDARPAGAGRSAGRCAADPGGAADAAELAAGRTAAEGTRADGCPADPAGRDAAEAAGRCATRGRDEAPEPVRCGLATEAARERPDGQRRVRPGQLQQGEVTPERSEEEAMERG